MIPGAFTYHRPSSPEEVVALLQEHGDEARVLAGGHSLIPMMKLRLAAPEHLVDLQSVQGLKGVRDEGGTLIIGAMTSQHELLADEILAARCPIIQETAALIADPQVRYCGTLGGNVANGDPGNDMPGLMQCLNAQYVLTGSGGQRQVAARDFYEAAYFTALEEGEFLTAVHFPAPLAGHGHAYCKLKRKVGDYATAAAAAILVFDGGACSAASVALTNLADTSLYAAEASQGLVGTAVDEAAIGAAVASAEAITDPASDGRGPSDYRRKMAGVMVRRALTIARDRAKR